jgi:hypothetical protein
MVLLLRITVTTVAGFAVSSPDPARLIIFLYFFLYFAGLVRHRNAAIR